MVNIPGKVYFDSPTALAKDPIEYQNQEKFGTPQFVSSNVPLGQFSGIELIEALHMVKVPPCQNADDPHQESIDEINEISSLSSCAEDVPLRRLTLGKSNPRITRPADRVILEDIKVKLNKSSSSHDSIPLSPKDISAKKVVRFKERSPSSVGSFTESVQSSSETITQDKDVDGNKMAKHLSAEVSI